MKHIIIEGGDRLGKNTLMKAILEQLNYDNVTIRHFAKPPKGLTPKESLDHQMTCFYKEANFVDLIDEQMTEDDWSYFPETVIWNRSHLGEYVYAQMFRGISKKDISLKLKQFEERTLHPKTYLITLTAAPRFFFSKEDGESFSQNLEQKTMELRLFKEIHALSLVKNKLLLKVDKNNEFRPAEDIAQEVINFIKD